MIEIEHRAGREETELGPVDWEPGWYAYCYECDWFTESPCSTEDEARDVAEEHAAATGHEPPE